MIEVELLHQVVQIHTKLIELISGLVHEMRGSKELFFGENDVFNEELFFRAK
jgi:hypothetical protein